MMSDPTTPISNTLKHFGGIPQQEENKKPFHRSNNNTNTPHAPGIPKNTPDPVGIPLKRGAWAINLTSLKRVKAWKNGPLRFEENIPNETHPARSVPLPTWPTKRITKNPSTEVITI